MYVCAIAAIMPSLSQLQSLSVSWNKSVGENLQQFVEHLPVECKLEELKLSSCDLNTDDLLHLRMCVMLRLTLGLMCSFSKVYLK